MESVEKGGKKVKQAEAKKTKKVADYKLGKIYRIRSPHTKYYYVGSTTEKYLSQRLLRHNSDFLAFMNAKNKKGYMYSFYVLEQGDAYIELVENFSCNDKHELKSREGYFIREGADLVCNRYEAGRDDRAVWTKTYRDKKKRIAMLQEQIKEKQDIITELEKEE